MSDQESKTAADSPDHATSDEPVAEQAASDSAGGEPAAQSADNTPSGPPPASGGRGGDGAGPSPRRSFSAVAWLALLLVLGLGGAAAWYLPQLQLKEEALTGRIEQLEAFASGKQENLDSVRKEIRQELDTELAEIRDELDEQRTALRGETTELQQGTSRLSRKLETMEAQLAKQRKELSRFNTDDRPSWLLAEAEYLLRLANQRLVMAGDTVAARALLESADKILREIDNVALHEVRRAVAADLAAVRAVPGIDVEGIYLRLSALIEQADQLQIFSLPEREAQPEAPADDDWRNRLREGYEAALQKLSEYIAIRRRDVPAQALMDPQWEGLLRQNLRMLLEQAQVALLSGNATLYRESLERAQHWVSQFEESDEATASAMSREIKQLAGLRVTADMPDVSRSLSALDEVVDKRLQQRGGDE
ncbi:MAG: uroporphyrinogen-III C-methyltransferase [Halioglobus sp.]|nr:uroporphyrinogen-III C-methyltransferase [Halioglobus sp.]